MKEIDLHARRPSFFSFWDCRVKILSLLGLVVLCALVKESITLILLLIFVLLLVKLSRLPVNYVADGLKLPVIFFLFITPALMMTVPGRILFSLGKINIYREGLFLAFTVVLKGFSMVFLFMLLFGTAPFNVTLKALRTLKLPPAIVMLLDFTYRFIFYYNEELSRSFKAAALRGLKKQSFFQGAATRGNLFLSLLIRGYEQSERVYGAMLLRGLDKTTPALHCFTILPKDLLKALVFLLVAGGLIVLEYT